MSARFMLLSVMSAILLIGPNGRSAWPIKTESSSVRSQTSEAENSSTKNPKNKISFVNPALTSNSDAVWVKLLQGFKDAQMSNDNPCYAPFLRELEKANAVSAMKELALRIDIIQSDIRSKINEKNENGTQLKRVAKKIHLAVTYGVPLGSLLLFIEKNSFLQNYSPIKWSQTFVRGVEIAWGIILGYAASNGLEYQVLTDVLKENEIDLVTFSQELATKKAELEQMYNGVIPNAEFFKNCINVTPPSPIPLPGTYDSQINNVGPSANNTNKQNATMN